MRSAHWLIHWVLAGLFIAGLGPTVPQTASAVPICALQGRGFTSPYAGEWVLARGVVTADLDETAKRGFFLQAQDCDGDPATSDGIFVYLGVRAQVVSTGDDIRVAGTVQEYNGRTEIAVDPINILRFAAGRPLPSPVSLNPPLMVSASDLYFESLEGMGVVLEKGRVVGPTDSDDRTWVVNAALGISRVFEEQPEGPGALICVDDAGLSEIQPEVHLGDEVDGLSGVMDLVAGDYCLELTASPLVVNVALTPTSISPPGSQEIHLATFNFNGLFDTFDDPTTDDAVLSQAAFQRRLQKLALAIHADLGEPDILALQEVENLAVLQALLARPEIATGYIAELVDGPDERGLDVALLYAPKRVRRLGESQVYQGCTRLVDGLGPDGNQDVYQPSNELTCDTDGDGIFDGNRLFSRPPLLMHFQVCPDGCDRNPAGFDLWVLVNHWKSRVEDSPVQAFTQPRRQAQADFVAGLVQSLRQAFPRLNLVVLGDLNDRSDASAVTTLTRLGFFNPFAFTDSLERYTYIYHGLAQSPDYALFSLRGELLAFPAEVVHINAAFPAAEEMNASTSTRSSDHDPLLVHLHVLDHFSFLPLVIK